ncbi:MAG: HD domain-containing protein [Candidatus Omnitrophica bacterium]|nr:HD domain-containing protein [Candidatus Omnitrophota bacterium]
MLEQDYLKDSATYNFKDERSKALNEYSSELIRELIIPKLTKEVNSSKRYAPLRQVYYSLILARWFKLRFSGKTGTYASLINTKDLTNLISKESWTKTDYFKQYQKSFSQGEYNIQEPVRTPTGQVIRSYFSGGINIASSAINTRNGIILSNDNANKLGDIIGGKAVVDTRSINLRPIVVASPIKNSGEESASSAVEINNINVKMYEKKLRPILQDKNNNVFNEIKSIDEKGELSQIFPVMESLKSKLKNRAAGVSVFKHTLRLVEELSLIENNKLDDFNNRIDTWRKESGKWEGEWWLFQGDEGRVLFDSYRKILQDIIKEPKDRELLYLAILLHDVGEHIKAQGHPNEGAKMIEPWLMQLGFDTEQIRKITSIIRSHVDLGTLFFGERTPDYLTSNPESLNPKQESEIVDYIKVLSISTLLDAGESIRKRKAEFYAKVGMEPIRSLNDLKEAFFGHRWKLFSSNVDDVVDDDKGPTKYDQVKEELEKLNNLITKKEMERFTEAIKSGIEVFDYGIFFFRGIKNGASLVKLLFIVHKLTKGNKITRVNLTAPSGVARKAAAEIEKNILINWDLRHIVQLSPGDLTKELGKKGLVARYKDGQLFIYNWEYYEKLSGSSSLKNSDKKSASSAVRNSHVLEWQRIIEDPKSSDSTRVVAIQALIETEAFDTLKALAPTLKKIGYSSYNFDLRWIAIQAVIEAKALDTFNVPMDYRFRKAIILELIGLKTGFMEHIAPTLKKIIETYSMDKGTADQEFLSTIIRELIKARDLKTLYTLILIFKEVAKDPNSNRSLIINAIRTLAGVGIHDIIENIVPTIMLKRIIDRSRSGYSDKSRSLAIQILITEKDFETIRDLAPSLIDDLKRFTYNVWDTEYLYEASIIALIEAKAFDALKILVPTFKEILKWDHIEPALRHRAKEALDILAASSAAQTVAASSAVRILGMLEVTKGERKKYIKIPYSVISGEDQIVIYYEEENRYADPPENNKLLVLGNKGVVDRFYRQFLCSTMGDHITERFYSNQGGTILETTYDIFYRELILRAETSQTRKKRNFIVKLEPSSASPIIQFNPAVAEAEGQEFRVREDNFQSFTPRAPSSDKASSSLENPFGGIDFRALPMTIQPMGSFQGLNFKLPQLSQAELVQINIDSEMQQIKNMVQSGIIPSGQRIKELIAACMQKKEMNSQANSLLLCLADIFKLEEENASESSPELREALVMVDSRS